MDAGPPFASEPTPSIPPALLYRISPIIPHFSSAAHHDTPSIRSRAVPERRERRELPHRVPRARRLITVVSIAERADLLRRLPEHHHAPHRLRLHRVHLRHLQRVRRRLGRRARRQETVSQVWHRRRHVQAISAGYSMTWPSRKKPCCHFRLGSLFYHHGRCYSASRFVSWLWSLAVLGGKTNKDRRFLTDASMAGWG